MLTDVGPTNIPTIFRTVHADLTWELCSFLCLDSAVVWYEGIQSGTVSPWWFSRFIWLFKGHAPKVLSMNALWTFVVCSLLYVEYFICPHYFGKSHRAQGGKQKLHFVLKGKSLNSPLKLVETEKTHGGYHDAIGGHAREITTGKYSSISKLNFLEKQANCWDFFLIVLAWRSIQGFISNYKSKRNDMGFCTVIWKLIIDLLEAGA